MRPGNLPACRPEPRSHWAIRLGIRAGIPHPRDGIGPGRIRDVESVYCVHGGKIARTPDFMVFDDRKGSLNRSPKRPGGLPRLFEMQDRENPGRQERRCASI